MIKIQIEFPPLVLPIGTVDNQVPTIVASCEGVCKSKVD